MGAGVAVGSGVAVADALKIEVPLAFAVVEADLIPIATTIITAIMMNAKIINVRRFILARSLSTDLGALLDVLEELRLSV